MSSAIASYLKRMTLKSVKRRDLELFYTRVESKEIAEYLKRMTLEYLRFRIIRILGASNAQECESKNMFRWSITC